jgi:hypothetical protein
MHFKGTFKTEMGGWRPIAVLKKSFAERLHAFAGTNI